MNPLQKSGGAERLLEQITARLKIHRPLLFGPNLVMTISLRCILPGKLLVFTHDTLPSSELQDRPLLNHFRIFSPVGMKIMAKATVYVG